MEVIHNGMSYLILSDGQSMSERLSLSGYPDLSK